MLTDVPRDAQVFNDEPFGPIAALQAFSRIDEAIAEANRLPFGLASYADTRSLRTAHQLARGWEVGMLWINQPASASAEMPFGGVKDAGYGSEGGPEALEAYLNTKSVPSWRSENALTLRRQAVAGGRAVRPFNARRAAWSR